MLVDEFRSVTVSHKLSHSWRHQATNTLRERETRTGEYAPRKETYHVPMPEHEHQSRSQTTQFNSTHSTDHNAIEQDAQINK